MPLDAKLGSVKPFNEAAATGLPLVLFFLMDFNSVDHMAPVAYKLLATGRGRPVLLFTNPFYNIANDYRLNFLQKEYGVGAGPVFTAWQGNLLVRRFMRWFCRPVQGRVRRWLYPKVLIPIGRIFYRRAWARQLLDKYPASALVFERQYAGGGLVGALITEGHRRGIRSYSLPHAVLSDTNELLTEAEVKLGHVPQRLYMNRYDCAVYDSKFHAQRALGEGVNPERVAVLGSARYAPEWAAVNQRIQPTVKGFQPSGDPTGRLKTVFMLSHWNWNVRRAPTLATLSHLSKLDFIYLVIKPHPRQGPADLKEFLGETLPPHVEIAWATPSPALIQWADAVLNIRSSIALEILLQGKPLIELRYLHANTLIYDELGACWLADSDAELTECLRRIKDGSPAPYGPDQVAKVMEAVVFGDPPAKDVLARYIDLILGAQPVGPEARRSAAGVVGGTR